MNGLTCFISKFLNTDDIDKIVQGNKIINPYYLGCYPANVKPDGVETKDCCCWVWNVDEPDKPGTHWVCVVKKRKNIICNVVYFIYLMYQLHLTLLYNSTLLSPCSTFLLRSMCLHA
jgi:hypothetical protein